MGVYDILSVRLCRAFSDDGCQIITEAACSQKYRDRSVQKTFIGEVLDRIIYPVRNFDLLRYVQVLLLEEIHEWEMKGDGEFLIAYPSLSEKWDTQLILISFQLGPDPGAGLIIDITPLLKILYDL